MNGWIKLHRKLLENPISKRPQWAWLWVVLLLKANHEGKKIIWEKEEKEIKRGEILTGRIALSEETGIAPSTIEDILNYLEKQHQIRQQKNTKNRLITILNYETYQTSDNESNNEPTTSRQRADTNKNYNNYKKDKNKIAPDGAVSEIPKFTELGADIIKHFESVDSKNKTYYSNRTQRSAADFLVSEYGFDEVLKRISVLPKTNRIPYFPTITTPYELKEKWVKLQDAVAKKKSEVKTNIIFS